MPAILGSSGAEEPPGEDTFVAEPAWMAGIWCRATATAMASRADALSAAIHRMRSTSPIERVISGQPPCRKVIYQRGFMNWQLGRLAIPARPLALRPRLATGLP